MQTLAAELHARSVTSRRCMRQYRCGQLWPPSQIQLPRRSSHCTSGVSAATIVTPCPLASSARTRRNWRRPLTGGQPRHPAGIGAGIGQQRGMPELGGHLQWRRSRARPPCHDGGRPAPDAARQAGIALLDPPSDRGNPARPELEVDHLHIAFIDDRRDHSVEVVLD